MLRGVGDVTVPKSRSLRFERTDNNANEWKYDMTVPTIEMSVAQGSQAAALPAGGAHRVSGVP